MIARRPRRIRAPQLLPGSSANRWFTTSRKIIQFITRCSMQFEVRGLENVPAEGGFLLVVNHRSNLDPPLIAGGLNRELSFVARRGLFQPAPWGWFLKKLNAVPVDRGRIGKQTFREVVRRLESGGPVLLFPEGTRSDGQELGTLKGGAFLLAEWTGVPVLPAVLVGTEQVLPRGVLLPRWFKRVVFQLGEPYLLADSGDRVSSSAHRTQALADLELRFVQLLDLAHAEPAELASE